MDTSTSNINSEISEVKIARLRAKLLNEVEWIKNHDVDERMIGYIPRALHCFAGRSHRKDYHALNDIILKYMSAILDVEKRCITKHLKQMFDNILPELTEWCGTIAINSNNAPFLRHFFAIWSEIVSRTGKSIQRLTGLHKTSALIDICETIFKIGHFHTQLNGLELFLRYVAACEEEEKEKLLEDIIPSAEFRRIRDLLCNFDVNNFEFDGRSFLNEFNMIISEEEPVYSIAVEKGYIGEKRIIKPMHEAKECVLWVDFNSATESISFYCHSTTFFPNTEIWINIEVKCPTKILIERKKNEFYVFANKDDIDVHPLPSRQIFLQPKIIFTFTYIENDLSNLQQVISCYNFKKKTNNDVNAECDRSYTGFKTVNIKANPEAECLAPKLPLPKVENKVRKPLQDLTWGNFPRSSPEKQLFKNITTRINKNQDFLAFKSDNSSAQNTSTGNKKLSTEEIVSTSDTSNVNMQRTTTTKKTNDNSNAGLAEPNTITKDSKLYTEANKKEAGWLAPKLPLPKVETKVRKPLQDLTWGNFTRSSPEKQLFKNITTRINKNQKDFLANTSTGNKKLSTEGIVSTSDTSNVNMQRTTTTKKTNDNSNAGLAESNTVTKDSKLYTEANEKGKITKSTALNPEGSPHKINGEMNNQKPFKEMTKDASDSQRFKKPGKSNIETVVHDNAIKSGKNEMKTVKYENRQTTNVASGSQKTHANISDKSHTETIVHDNRETINAKRNQKTNTKNSGKAEIEIVVNDYCIQKANTEKSGKTRIETISCLETASDTNPKNEMHIPNPQNISELNPPPETIPQNKSSDYMQKECGSETNAEKAFDTDVNNLRQSPKSASKRKLYTSIPEVHTGTQLSKDSQLQRRKYLQERRKKENRNSLKLINLVKPLDFSENNNEVKDQENSNVINALITGNEEQNQETVDEYVKNKGYVGIKSSLKCPEVANKFTLQEQEAIENNLKTLNLIFSNSAKKFFKSETTSRIEQIDVYNVRNIEDDPAPAKKGRKRKIKEKVIPPIKMNFVPKYNGTNGKVSHSYRRSIDSNLGNMKKVLTTTESIMDFDKLKQSVNFNTTAKETPKPEPVNAVGELKKEQSARLKENINNEKSESSKIIIDPMNTTGPAEITAEAPRKTSSSKSSKSSNNTHKGNNTPVQQISNQSLNPLSNQTVHEENSNKSLNRSYTSEESVTHSVVQNEAMNNQSVKTNTLSSEIELCNSAMANQSMAPNISFETKDSSGNRNEAKQKNSFEKKRDSAQSDCHKTNSMAFVRLSGGFVKLSEAKPGKYTSYDQNWNRNPEKSLNRSNYPSSTITIPLQEFNDTTNESNWLIKKFLNSIPDRSKSNRDMETSSSDGGPIVKNGQTICQLDIEEYCEDCLNNFEDDNVDLDSYYSLGRNDCICNEEDIHLNGDVGNAAEQNFTEVINLELQVQAHQSKESLEKRKSSDPESNEIIRYKRVRTERTETTTEYSGTGIGGEILSNLRGNLHQFFASAVSNIHNNSDSEEIKRRLIEQLSTFMMSCERHNLQSFESWKQQQKLLDQIDKEKERFQLESFAAFNQYSRTQEALAELKNISKTKDAKNLELFENIRINMRETVANKAKAEWEAYINNLISNVVQNIQKHKDFNLQL